MSCATSRRDLRNWLCRGVFPKSTTGRKAKDGAESCQRAIGREWMGVKSGYMELAARLELELRTHPNISTADLIRSIRSILSKTASEIRM